MAQLPVNPFDETQDAPPPQVPISGNPFDEGGIPNAPPPATLAGKAADFLKPASNTFSFGMRDRAEGLQRYLQGDAPNYSAGVEQAVADSAMRRERSPYLSVAGDVAGGTAQAALPGAGIIGREASLALGGANAGLRGTAARIAGYGLEGGVLGAGQAAGSTYTGNPQDYARAALAGGALGSALGAPFGKFADVAPRSLAEIPNSGDLKASSRAKYEATHNIPVEYDANHFWNGVDQLEQNLYARTNQIKSPSVWETMRLAREGRPQANQPGVTGATVSPKNIDDLRQQLTGVAEPGASQARLWLDQYMASPAGMVKGNAAQRDQIARTLTAARGDWRAGKRTQAVEEVNQYADDRSRVANSGMNAGNTYAQQLTSRFLNPKSAEAKWLTPAEKDEVRATTKVAPWYNSVRATGNILGGGLGIGAGGYGAGGAMTAFATGDIKPFIAGVGVPAAGYAVKSAGNRAMINSAERLADTVAMRSPLYRERAANAPMVAGPGLSNKAESARNALTVEMLNQLRMRDLTGEQP